MTSHVTRTINPLPFNDLEPHRFEDMARQLAYDFREWTSLEAVGRSGSDEGIDIRGLEVVHAAPPESDSDDDVGDDASVGAVGEARHWLFQCKRNKSFAPARMKAVVDEALASLQGSPYGLVLVVACDVSKKARDAFRAACVSKGIREFFVWARGELEDMLFQAKNDHLLFAYFGISLQQRRRSQATTLRSRIATKKKLANLLQTEEYSREHKLFLVRDPDDSSYRERAEKGKWHLCRFANLKHPDLLTAITGGRFGYVAPDGKGWDVIKGFDSSKELTDNDLRHAGAWIDDEPERQRRPSPEQMFYEEYVPQERRMNIFVLRWIDLDRIIAIDPIGDGRFPVPHVFVSYRGEDGPFEPGQAGIVDTRFHRGAVPSLAEEDHVDYFPTKIPAKPYPPPSGFDGPTPKSKWLLSEAAVAKLEMAIAGGVRLPSQAAHRDEPVDSSVSERSEFRRWRDEVAVPVFSAIVERLRAADEWARVSVREDGNGESISLRLSLRWPLPFDHEHRFERSIDARWDGLTKQIEIVIGNWFGRESRSAPPRYAIPNLPSSRLEDIVMEVIDTLIEQRKSG